MDYDKQKNYISKKYNIPLYKLHDDLIQYYYTHYPSLCCKYNLKPIDTIKPFDYIGALTYLNNYYNNKYFEELLQMVLNTNNDITTFSSKIKDSIVKEFIKFRENAYCLTIWPLYTWPLDDLINFLETFGYVYYVKVIKLGYNAALGLVHQLYSDTSRFPTIEKIKEKVKYLGYDGNDKKEIRVIFFENVSTELISGSQAPLKNKIRELLLTKVNDKNIRGDDLVHINDHYYQTIEYSQIFLHDETLKFLEKQNLMEHLSFDKSRLYINTIKQWLIKNVSLIDYERFIIMSSGILYAYGIRECRDVDGLMLSGKNDVNELTAKYFYDKKTKFPFADFGIIGSKWWKKSWDDADKKWFEMLEVEERDEIIFRPENHFYFNGLKFMTLKAEMYRKLVRGKYHDIGDILMIDNLLGIKMDLSGIVVEDIDNLKKYLGERYGLGNEDINVLIKKYL